MRDTPLPEPRQQLKITPYHEHVCSIKCALGVFGSLCCMRIAPTMQDMGCLVSCMGPSAWPGGCKRRPLSQAEGNAGFLRISRAGWFLFLLPLPSASRAPPPRPHRPSPASFVFLKHHHLRSAHQAPPPSSTKRRRRPCQGPPSSFASTKRSRRRRITTDTIRPTT